MNLEDVMQTLQDLNARLLKAERKLERVREACDIPPSSYGTPLDAGDLAISIVRALEGEL